MRFSCQSFERIDSASLNEQGKIKGCFRVISESDMQKKPNGKEVGKETRLPTDLNGDEERSQQFAPDPIGGGIFRTRIKEQKTTAEIVSNEASLRNPCREESCRSVRLTIFGERRIDRICQRAATGSKCPPGTR